MHFRALLALFAFLLLGCEGDGGLVQGIVTPTEGGTVTTEDGKFILTVPAGAVDQDTVISIRTVAESGGIGGVGYELSPDGLEFQEPVPVTFQYPLGEYTTSDGQLIGAPLVRTASGIYEVLGEATTEVNYVTSLVTTTGELRHFSLVIISNIASIQSQTTGNRTQMTLQKSFQRLSTGLRINSSSDDAAGLAVSESLRASVRSFQLEASNASDAISLTQTCEGGLPEIYSILQRLREVASANAQTVEGLTSNLTLEDENSAPLGELVFSVVYPAICGSNDGLAICPQSFSPSMTPTQTGSCTRSSPVDVSGSFMLSAGEGTDTYNLSVTLSSSHSVRPFEVLLKLRASDRKLFVGSTEGPDGTVTYSAWTVRIADGQVLDTWPATGTRSVSGDETTWTVEVPGLRGAELLGLVDYAGLEFTDDVCFGNEEISLPDWGTCPW